MKITLDPMLALRSAAVAKINAHFDAKMQPHREAAWAMKRAAAEAGAPFPDWFSAEADMRGVTSAALASLVLTKPDKTGQRELTRQRALLALDAAKSPSELDAIVDKLHHS